MKKILMIVFNDIDKDSRVQRAAMALNDNFDLTVISYGQYVEHKFDFNVIKFKLNGRSALVRYFEFIFELLNELRDKKFDVLYAHDFYCALPLLILKIKKKSDKFIYDAHELHIPEKYKQLNLRDKFFYFFEKKAIKKADLIICAQENRAQIMKEHYKLNKYPLVIKNISYLPNSKNDISKNILSKYKDFFEKKAISVVYVGAISEERRILDLVSSINELGKDYKLLIIGDGNYFSVINEKIKNINNSNILIINAIPYNCLAPILKQFDIGYLYYPNKYLNNIYCAPNKIFEYASVGLPMISFYNPTLDEIFKKYNIGLCGEDLKEILVKISSDISKYKANLSLFVSDNKWDNEAENLRIAVNTLLNGDEYV